MMTRRENWELQALPCQTMQALAIRHGRQEPGVIDMTIMATTRVSPQALLKSGWAGQEAGTALKLTREQRLDCDASHLTLRR